MPAWLTEPERATWTELMAALDPLQVVTAADTFSLGTFSKIFTEYRRIDALLQKAGDTVIVMRNDRGDVSSVTAHPYVKQREYLEKESRLWLEKFFLVPSSRPARPATTTPAARTWRELLLEKQTLDPA